MTAFLWTVLILLALESLGKALWIAKGDFPRRTAGATVADLILGVLLACWAAYLLSGLEACHG